MVSFAGVQPKLIVANVGDSRAILCRKSSQDGFYVIEMSKDHKFNRTEEIERIKASKGSIKESASGHFKVIPNMDDYAESTIIKQKLALNMTRSLGHPILSKYGVGQIVTLL